MIIGTTSRLKPQPQVFNQRRRRALELASEIGGLPFADVFELRAGVRERLSRGDDLNNMSIQLRPLMNRVLDIIDVSSLSSSQAHELEREFFASLAAASGHKRAA